MLDFLSPATKFIVIRKNKLCNPNRVVCNDFGANFLNSYRQKTPMMAKIAFWSPEMTLNEFVRL